MACAAVHVLPAQPTGGSRPNPAPPKPPAPTLPAFTKVPTTFEGLFAER